MYVLFSLVAYAACDVNTVAQLFLLHKQESQREVLKKIGRVDLSHILMCSKTKAVLCISKYSPWQTWAPTVGV